MSDILPPVSPIDPPVSPIDEDPRVLRLHADLAGADLVPLWTQRDDLMPVVPAPAARPHVWRWNEVLPLVEEAGEVVAVGRGGERRAIALANPGLGGAAFATPTLWAAVQFLGPAEVAPAHRHSQNAFRFVLEGEGVWTVVDGDPVAMRRGDLLLTAGWAWHEHHNTAAAPMVWLDGLDIPLVAQLDGGFFEFGADEVSDRTTPSESRTERLWAHPGLRPIAAPSTVASPLSAYRWAHTDAALTEQLALEDDGYPGVMARGHAAVRFMNPATGGDALPTLRTEMHRLRAGAATTPLRTVGSSVWQVFTGRGAVELGDERFEVGHGDLIAVPSWCRLRITADADLDLFTFGDAPVYEALRLDRTEREEPT